MAAVEPDPLPGTWGTCRYCGVAVPHGASRCAECGADRPVAAGGLAREPAKVRRRIRLLRVLRTAVIVGVVLALLYAIVPAILQGPTVVTNDPLTTSGTYTLAPGNFTVIAGEMTGGDYVVGNFTTVDPVGVSLAFAVYNSTAWAALEAHRSAPPAWALPAADTGRIIFSAPVTDSYYFVFTNPYAPSSHLNVSAYIVTEYEPNVTGGGLG